MGRCGSRGIELGGSKPEFLELDGRDLECRLDRYRQAIITPIIVAAVPTHATTIPAIWPGLRPLLLLLLTDVELELGLGLEPEVELESAVVVCGDPPSVGTREVVGAFKVEAREETTAETVGAMSVMTAVAPGFKVAPVQNSVTIPYYFH